MRDIPVDFKIYHMLMSGLSVNWTCQGSSMEPVYSNGDGIIIYPFTKKRPDPVIGDVVHFWAGGGFNRHQVGDIVTMRNGDTFYSLYHGDGTWDRFVTREQIIGYVVPKMMYIADTEPCKEYGRLEL